MGLIQAIKGAATGVLADSWLEFFYCDSLDDDTLMVKGQKRVSGRSSNTKGEDNIISNGARIAVNEGQCMLIVEQGAVVDVCAEPGEFIYDKSSEPSIFYGGLGKGILDTFKTIGKRFTFGGDTGKDQRVYYVNIKEIFNNKYGTQTPIQYRVVVDPVSRASMTLSIRCNGEYTFKIANPLTFYQKVAGNIEDAYEKSKLSNFMRSDVLSALNPALGKLSSQKVEYADITNHTLEITDELRATLSARWLETRGMEFVSFTINSMTLPTEQQEKLNEIEENRVYTDPSMLNSNLARGMVSAMNAAASNDKGSMVGMMGVGMAMNSMGQMGMNPMAMAQQQAMYQQPQQGMPQQNMQPQQGAAASQAPAGDSWVCKCGAVCTGKFCTECGEKKPMAEAEGWTCQCGTVNKGNFCQNCGSKRPAGAPLYRCDKCGWEPEDPKNPPKFCPECGDPFTDSDIQK